MNYELTIGGGVTQRRLSVPYRCEPPLHIVCKPTICHVPPSTAARLQHIAVQNQTGDVRDLNICFSLMFSPSCQSLRVTSRLVLPHFSETAGSAAGVYPVIWLGGGPVFTALLLITEPGERATPTHWLIGSFAQHAGTLLVKMWRTDACSVAFLLQIHSHILLLHRLHIICWLLYVR